MEIRKKRSAVIAIAATVAAIIVCGIAYRFSLYGKLKSNEYADVNVWFPTHAASRKIDKGGFLDGSVYKKFRLSEKEVDAVEKDVAQSGRWLDYRAIEKFLQIAGQQLTIIVDQDIFQDDRKALDGITAENNYFYIVSTIFDKDYTELTPDEMYKLPLGFKMCVYAPSTAQYYFLWWSQ